MRKLSTLILLVVAIMATQAQTDEATFRSDGFRLGVQRHLGLSKNDAIPVSRLDTITSIDLSGLKINDISDVEWLPNVKRLNLSMNEIEDIAPVLRLDSLQHLNLKSNQLENIDMLVFANVDSMRVNVSDNFIQDFSFFFNPTICHFEFIGMGAQTEKNAPFIKFNQFYTDIDDQDGSPVATFRGQTNFDQKLLVMCEDATQNVELSEESQTVNIPGNPTETAMVILKSRLSADTTWYVAPKSYRLQMTESKTVTADLPDGYEVGYAIAYDGKVKVNGNRITYTAPDRLFNDNVYFSFSKDGRLKGFSRINFKIGKPVPTDIKTMENSDLALAFKDNLLTVDCDDSNVSGPVNIRVFDALGRLLAQQEVESGSGIHTQLRLAESPAEVIIVQLQAREWRRIGKCAVR